MFDDRDIYESDMGSFDENGFYKLPLTIENMDELKDTLDTMVPDGYTKLFKKSQSTLSQKRFLKLFGVKL